MRIYIVILFLVLSGSLSAQQSVVSGLVTDAGNNPLEFVSVQVEGSTNGTYTDTKGRYTLSVSKTDTTTLLFTSMGYIKVRRELGQVTDDMTVNTMMRTDEIELQEVVVTRNRHQTGAMESIHMGQGRRTVDATGGSVESSVIMSGTGVSSTNELSTQYSVRGGSYDENIIYVNGIEVYRPLLIRSGQQEGLSFINPDLTAGVQFSSGGFDARYGDRMSSVLDITYKRPQTFEGGFSGSLLGGNVYVGSATGKFSQMSGLRYKRGTTLLSTLDSKGDYDPTNVDFQTYMTYQFTPRTQLNVFGNYSENTYDFVPRSRKTSYGTMNNAKSFEVYYDGAERDRFRTFFGAASLRHILSEYADINLQVSAFRSLEEETYDIAGEYWISSLMDEESDAIGVGSFHQHARNHLNAEVMNASLGGTIGIEHHSLRWTVGMQQENIKDRIREWERRDSLGYSLPYDENILKVQTNLLSRNDIASTRFFGYVQDTYRWKNDLGSFALTAGIRGSYWNYNREFILSPRASIGFVPAANSNLTFRFATGIYYQSPFYKEFRITNTDEQGNSYISLNDQIESQRSIHFVLGGDYVFGDSHRPFKLTAETYYKKLDRLVPYTVDNVKVWYYGENVSDGYVTGIDTKLFGQFVPGTDSWLGFSLMQAKQYIDGVKVPMPTDQLYNFTFYFTDYVPGYEKIQMNLRAIWAQGLPFSVPGYEYQAGLRAPSYRRVDIGMTYSLWNDKDRGLRGGSFLNNFKQIWVGIDVFNLLDIKNVSSYSWFTDLNGYKNAIPDRLTGRQFNIKLGAEF